MNEVYKLTERIDELKDTLNALRLDLDNLTKRLKKLEADGVPVRAPGQEKEHDQ